MSSLSILNVSRRIATHRRKIVQNIPARFISKDPERRDGENRARDERDRGRYMGHAREPIERRRAQASIYEQGVVVTNECEADDANRLEYARANKRKPF